MDSSKFGGINSISPNMGPPQAPKALNGPVAILWDIENCSVPSNVSPEDVSGNILMALRVHPVIKGAVTLFSAYGDFNAFPRKLREGCQRTGVKLVDVPNGRKDAADKAILVDMFLFALDNPSPSSIFLISGDVDFAHALHVLGQRDYTIVLVVPTGVSVSSALSNAGRFVYDWPRLARGEGFVPPQAFVTHGLSPQSSRQELQKLRVSHSSEILPSTVEVLNEQRYKKALDYQIFRVTELEEMKKKMKKFARLEKRVKVNSFKLPAAEKSERKASYVKEKHHQENAKRVTGEKDEKKKPNAENAKKTKHVSLNPDKHVKVKIPAAEKKKRVPLDVKEKQKKENVKRATQENEKKKKKPDAEKAKKAK